MTRRSIALKGAVCLVAAILSGCSSLSPKGRLAPAPSYQVDIETSEEEELRAIRSTPTAFELPIYEDTYALERAYMFFREYTGGAPQEGRGSSGQLALWSKQSIGGYSVEIERIPADGVFRYYVRCTVRSSDGSLSVSAKLCAQNVARFIREGRLDRSLFPSVGEG